MSAASEINVTIRARISFWFRPAISALSWFCYVFSIDAERAYSVAGFIGRNAISFKVKT